MKHALLAAGAIHLPGNLREDLVRAPRLLPVEDVVGTELHADPATLAPGPVNGHREALTFSCRLPGRGGLRFLSVLDLRGILADG
jgi:hypothetical protein